MEVSDLSASVCCLSVINVDYQLFFSYLSRPVSVVSTFLRPARTSILRAPEFFPVLLARERAHGAPVCLAKMGAKCAANRSRPSLFRQ